VRGSLTPMTELAPTVTVDVVVVAYNNRDTLRNCVEPLAGLPWVTVTVVDNACPERSAETVADLPVRVIRSPRNGGFAYGCNLGTAEASSEFVLLLNPDARVDAEGLTTLATALMDDLSLGAVGPRTVDEGGELVWSQRHFPRVRSSFAQALFLQRLAPRAGWTDEVIRDERLYARPNTPDWVAGACLLLRREVWEAFGGLDDGFFLYSEETDLLRRMRDAGLRVGYVPDAVAYHEGGASAPRSTTRGFEAHSRVRYARKHHGAAVALLEAIAIAVGALTHAAVLILRPSLARGHVEAGRAAFVAVLSRGGPA
jgi:N-acetylglucosaminyl-diphospho-decaprenol L-rhamnosyltransferase